ncbi:plasmid replication protein RepC [Microvirga sesbaniae]|uniref:plasmid replication protein RepC n=1 Tax=Microvirga sesbaniae TaxID=681392 RepID=UPI0021C60950|nr:plasmid replication protein RepC [Microvirga sp. HBU67692]
MNPQGLRPMSAAHARVERAVTEKFVNEKPTTKSAVLYALKKAAPALKLRPTTWRLLSVLCDLSHPIDWEDRKIGPVVWPSNAALADRVGVDVRSIQVHLRRLVQMGLITHSDSATRKRFGTRVNNRIVQACGINLTPLMIRREQFLELAETHQAELAERKKLAQLISETRIRVIRLIAGGQDSQIAGPWVELAATFARLGEQYGMTLSRPTRTVKASLADLHTLLSSLITLEVSAQSAWNQHLDATELVEDSSPAGDKGFTQNPNLIHKKDDSLNQRAAEDVNGIKAAPYAPKSEIQQERTKGLPLDLNQVQRACPALSQYYPDAFSSVHKLASSIHQLRGLLGISGKLWDEAQRSLGPIEASLSLLVILQGHEDGRISNPGGYLHSIVSKTGSHQSSMGDVIARMAASRTHDPRPSVVFPLLGKKEAERHAG